MTLSSPLLLIVGLLVTAALAWAAVVSARRRTAMLAAAGVAVPGGRRAYLGVGLTIAGVGVLAIATAGPAAMVPVPRTAGTVILAIDVSNSMGADDVAPTRLAAAQRAARAFVAAQPDSVDIGVVAFERGALTTARPDADHSKALAAIDRLKLTGGTSLGTAIMASLSAITGKQVALGRDGTAPDIGYWPSATIVMFSDGQNQGADVEAAAAAAQRAGVHIHTVGVGTTAGATVQVDGYHLQTSLEEDTLTLIAQTTGGAYHPASDAARLDGIADTIDLRLTVSDEPLPLAGGLIGLALALLTAGAALTVLRSGRVI
ncbi:Ca-activated chloride channel family protein [Thermocatellispora tengchongensis]|uniref:Ca-activated chloride channel family protein n=1 Tax=Thermocatellispora tengchongensis TaxID=1073253 RepID=A0A840P9X2_9ACTN|nr:VWA domain-containing protein [Thermocatellispora tengchongensis]MBB5134220.1 Ca-activated chloride channel family protein [Thermocatellispora tengchongensis]